MADHWEIVRSWELKVETNLKIDNVDEAEVWLLMSVKFNVKSLWRDSCNRMNIGGTLRIKDWLHNFIVSFFVYLFHWNYES